MTKVKKNTNKYKLDAKEQFLIETGVSDHNGIKPRMNKKYKQIGRFTEILSDKLNQSGATKQKRVKVIDIGAGKGYMTFAIYNYLAKSGLDPVIHAVDFNEDLMKLGNENAAKCGFENLSFISDFADQYSGLAYYDAVVSLHACDTATDDALFMGLKMKSKVILCAPCCQKEVLVSLKEHKSLTKFISNGLFLHKMADLFVFFIHSGLNAIMVRNTSFDEELLFCIELVFICVFLNFSHGMALQICMSETIVFQLYKENSNK